MGFSFSVILMVVIFSKKKLTISKHEQTIYVKLIGIHLERAEEVV